MKMERVFLCACVSGCVRVSVISHACVGLGEGWVHAAASAILVVMMVITGVKSSKYCLCISSRGAHKALAFVSSHTHALHRHRQAVASALGSICVSSRAIESSKYRLHQQPQQQQSHAN